MARLKHASIAPVSRLLGRAATEKWSELSYRTHIAADGHLPSIINHELEIAALADPDSPVAPAYLLWAARNLAREYRSIEALHAFDRTLAIADGVEELVPGLNFTLAALRHKARAAADSRDHDTAIKVFRAIAELDNPAQYLYDAGLVAEGAGMDEEASCLYMLASNNPPISAANLPAQLAHRAMLRLQNRDYGPFTRYETLAQVLKKAVESGNRATLERLASPTHFSAGPLGGNLDFVGNEILERLLHELRAGGVHVSATCLGTGAKRYLPTYGWHGHWFRGTVLFFLERSPSSVWQWSGVIVTAPTDSWIERWEAAEPVHNDPLTFTILAPWPENLSFRAGGLRWWAKAVWKFHKYKEYMKSPCGFGPGGFHYNQDRHQGKSAYAVDFARFEKGKPIHLSRKQLESIEDLVLHFEPRIFREGFEVAHNLTRSTPTLAVADGIVRSVRDGYETGSPAGSNRVKIRHMVGDNNYASSYVHLDGPNLIRVTEGMYVRTGDELGPMDDTGRSAWDHLHFAIFRVDADGKERKGVRPSPMDGQSLGNSRSGKCIKSSNRIHRHFSQANLAGRGHNVVFSVAQSGQPGYCVILTGVALIDAVGRWGYGWRKQHITLRLDLPPIRIDQGLAFHVSKATALVVPTSIGNDGVANHAGWAVDQCGASMVQVGQDYKVDVTADIAVNDSDGWISRIAYQVVLLGSAVRGVPVN